MTAYDASEWSDLFLATAGASAALAGLVFVAVSINVERILRLEGVPERALETVMLLLGAVVVSVIGLMPGLDTAALGALLLGEGLLFGAGIAALARRASVPRPGEGLSLRVGRQLVVALGAAPIVIGGASILVEAGGGLYWIGAGLIGAVVAGVGNAWVLLVEILR